MSHINKCRNNEALSIPSLANIQIGKVIPNHSGTSSTDAIIEFGKQKGSGWFIDQYGGITFSICGADNLSYNKDYTEFMKPIIIDNTEGICVEDSTYGVLYKKKDSDDLWWKTTSGEICLSNNTPPQQQQPLPLPPSGTLSITQENINTNIENTQEIYQSILIQFNELQAKITQIETILDTSNLDKQIQEYIQANKTLENIHEYIIDVNKNLSSRIDSHDNLITENISQNKSSIDQLNQQLELYISEASKLSTNSSKEDIDQLSQQLTQYSSSVINLSNLSNEVAEHKANTSVSLSNLSNEIAEHKANTNVFLSNISNEVAEHKSNVANLSNEVAEYKANTNIFLSNLSVNLDEHKSNVANLSNEITEYKTNTSISLSNLSNEITEYKTNTSISLSNLSNEVAEHKSNVTNLSNEIAEHKANTSVSLSNLSNEITEHKSNVANLSNEVAEHKANTSISLSNLSVNLDEHKSNVTNLSNEVAEHKANTSVSLSNLSVNLDEHKNNIATQLQIIDISLRDITSRLDEKILAIQHNLELYKQEIIRDVTKKITDVYTEIDKQKVSASTQDKQILSLENNYNDTNKKIEQLDNDIKNLNRENIFQSNEELSYGDVVGLNNNGTISKFIGAIWKDTKDVCLNVDIDDEKKYKQNSKAYLWDTYKEYSIQLVTHEEISTQPDCNNYQSKLLLVVNMIDKNDKVINQSKLVINMEDTNIAFDPLNKSNSPDPFNREVLILSTSDNQNIGNISARNVQEDRQYIIVYEYNKNIVFTSVRYNINTDIITLEQSSDFLYETKRKTLTTFEVVWEKEKEMLFLVIYYCDQFNYEFTIISYHQGSSTFEQGYSVYPFITGSQSISGYSPILSSMSSEYDKCSASSDQFDVSSYDKLVTGYRESDNLHMTIIPGPTIVISCSNNKCLVCIPSTIHNNPTTTDIYKDLNSYGCVDILYDIDSCNMISLERDVSNDTIVQIWNIEGLKFTTSIKKKVPIHKLFARSITGYSIVENSRLEPYKLVYNRHTKIYTIFFISENILAAQLFTYDKEKIYFLESYMKHLEVNISYSRPYLDILTPYRDYKRSAFNACCNYDNNESYIPIFWNTNTSYPVYTKFIDRYSVSRDSIIGLVNTVSDSNVSLIIKGELFVCDKDLFTNFVGCSLYLKTDISLKFPDNLSTEDTGIYLGKIITKNKLLLL